MSTSWEVALVVTGLVGAAVSGGAFFAFSNFVMPALAKLQPGDGAAAMQAINIAAPRDGRGLRADQAAVPASDRLADHGEHGECRCGGDSPPVPTPRGASVVFGAWHRVLLTQWSVQSRGVSGGMMNTTAMRSRWAAIGAAVAVVLGAGSIGLVTATSPSDATAYVPVTPCRISDTRPPFLKGPKNTPIGANQTHTIGITDANTDCTGPTAIPATATGLQLNVTAIGATAETFLTFYEAGTSRPTASSLNPTPGQPPTPNAVPVKINSEGKFSVYNLAGNVDVAIDIVGYYTDHNHDDRYYQKSEVDTAVGAKANSADVYTKAEVDTAVGAKANSADVYTKAEVDTAVGAKANSADVYTKTEVDTAVATKVTAGEVTISHGPGSWTNRLSTTFEQRSTGMRMSGDGHSYLSLHGPETRGGVEYTLKEVEWCIIGRVAPATIWGTELVGYVGTSSFNSQENTTKNATGCYTIVPSAAVRGGEAFLFYISAAGGPAGSITVGSVKSTWDTRTALMSADASPSSSVTPNDGAG